MEDKSKFTPPRNITLDKYQYSFKDNLTNDYYSYRCKHRNICKIYIKIAKTELIKLSDNNENQNILFTITSKEKNHLCLNNNNKKEVKLKAKRIKTGFFKNYHYIKY